MNLICRFCSEILDPEFDRPLIFKGHKHVICSLETCQTITALKDSEFLFKGGLESHSMRNMPCKLDYQFCTLKNMYMVEFNDGTKEVCHEDKIFLSIEEDL